MAKMVRMRQEKWVPPILTGGTEDSERISANHGTSEVQHQVSVVVKIGQVWYEKHQRVIYDPYLRRRYPVEMWVSTPEHVKA